MEVAEWLRSRGLVVITDHPFENRAPNVIQALAEAGLIDSKDLQQQEEEA